MKGIGLVFAGGGGKGAYEIGVWKYLHEIGLDQYIRVVSGTSVGALNAALVVGSSYEVAEKLWMNIREDKILTPKEITAEDILRWLISNGLERTSPIVNVVSKVVSGTITGIERIVQMLLNRVTGDYLFSREGLIQMISEGLNFSMLQNSEIPCYVTCIKCNGLKVKRFKLNDYSEEDIIQLLLASSAIPVIFRNEEFQGDKYCDGGIPGIGDNIPVKPVYDTGVEMIVVVHLSQETMIDKEQFPNARIVEIVPQENLGNSLSGTLDFSPEGSLYRIQLGYNDAKKVMQPMVEMMKMTAINKRMLEKAKQRNERFEKRRENLKTNAIEIEEKMKKDGLDPFNWDFRQALSTNFRWAKPIALFYGLQPVQIHQSIKGFLWFSRLFFTTSKAKRHAIFAGMRIARVYGEIHGFFANEKDNPRCRYSNEKLELLMKKSVQDAIKMSEELEKAYRGEMRLGKIFDQTFSGKEEA